MPTLLSLCAIPPQTPAPLAGALALAAGPDGLFCVRQDGAGLVLEALAQPMSGLACAMIAGERLLVGGTPLGVASISLADLTTQAETGATGGWQAGWMDYTQRPVIALAGSVGGENSDDPTLVAACLGDGILRSANGGLNWELVNTGLADPGVYCVAWAPPAPPERWPPREIVFAGSETGLSRSPAGGRAWHPCAGISGTVHAVAVAADFHTSGIVLALSGSEDEADAPTLWRSADGGRS
ncbi:MAG: WD40/YVTN/BNR-like repeat-containing protein, partial [Caldilineaceae bacterium]